ncbi:hypothetical protein N665_0231s0002 [Sinapis alba]|nr:hypothetical protein N665_0231s0002 [Sinapis alba]
MNKEERRYLKRRRRPTSRNNCFHKTFIDPTNSARHKYDTLSYKLNFKDEGQDDDDEDEAGFGGFRSFSMRYASVPDVFGKAPAVSSVDSVK